MSIKSTCLKIFFQVRKEDKWVPVQTVLLDSDVCRRSMGSRFFFYWYAAKPINFLEGAAFHQWHASRGGAKEHPTVFDVGAAHQSENPLWTSPLVGIILNEFAINGLIYIRGSNSVSGNSVSIYFHRRHAQPQIGIRPFLFFSVVFRCS